MNGRAFRGIEGSVGGRCLERSAASHQELVVPDSLKRQLITIVSSSYNKTSHYLSANDIPLRRSALSIKILAKGEYQAFVCTWQLSGFARLLTFQPVVLVSAPSPSSSLAQSRMLHLSCPYISGSTTSSVYTLSSPVHASLPELSASHPTLQWRNATAHATTNNGSSAKPIHHMTPSLVALLSLALDNSPLYYLVLS